MIIYRLVVEIMIWLRDLSVPKFIVGCMTSLVILTSCFLILFPRFYYQQDREAIRNRYTLFLQALKNGNLEVAYGYMSSDYQQTCSLVDFRSDYGFDSHVDFIEFSDHHYLTVSGDTARLYPQFRWIPLWNGPEYELKKIDGVWYLTGEYIMYVDESAIENYGRYCPFE